MAHESASLARLEKLVTGRRLRLAARTGAMLRSLTPPAIDQLVEISVRRSQVAVERSAELARLIKMCRRSRRGGLEKQLADLEARMGVPESAARNT